MNYAELLNQAPDHTSYEFIQYLRDNNHVDYEDENWIVIYNFKYNEPTRPWMTAFWKPYQNGWPAGIPSKEIQTLFNRYCDYDWNWLIKARKDQSVGRFHIHLHK